MTPRILFVHNNPTRFVQMDLSLLAERYAVREWYQRTRAINLASLARAVQQTDLLFGWFASWHSFFPLLLASAYGRPTVLVIGGYDTANLRDIGYGSQRGGPKQWIARKTMSLATRLITNSEFAREEAVQNARVDPKRVTVIYHGFAAGHPPVHSRKEKLVVTAGNVDTGNLKRKGLEAFVRAARLLPEACFVLIGAWRDQAVGYLRKIASPNVHFTGWVGDQEMQGYFSRASVYVQASRHEGFGMALAEAMLCECVPVVTRAGALPEVVGEAGIYVDSPSPLAVAEGVRVAFAHPADRGQRARERIASAFPLAHRREGLFDIVENAANGRE